MKMTTLNISLPEPMDEYVRGRCKQEYGNVSEFFRELVREKMREEIAADLKFLESTSAGAQPGPTEAEIEDIVALQKNLRKKSRARRV